MKSVIVFPDTVPAAKLIIPLVPVFDRVVYCRAVENDDCHFAEAAHKLADATQCEIHVPAPLGKNRERFLHLVRDLRERRDDYAARLAHLSLAGISSGSRVEAEARSAILSSLMSGQTAEKEADGQREKVLWQARLVLKLGEQHDEDRRKIAEDLLRIRMREQRLFNGLRDEEEAPFSLTGRLTSLAEDSAATQGLRLKAWSRLFGLGVNPPAESRFFATTNPDALDRLAAEHERATGIRPLEFLTVPLPAGYPDEERFPEQLHRFRQDEGTKAVLTELLGNPAAATEEQRRMFAGPGGEWSVLLETYFPARDCGRCQLQLFTFPRVHVRRLFLGSFGHDEAYQAHIAEEAPQDCVIGLVSES